MWQRCYGSNSISNNAADEKEDQKSAFKRSRSIAQSIQGSLRREKKRPHTICGNLDVEYSSPAAIHIGPEVVPADSNDDLSIGKSIIHPNPKRSKSLLLKALKMEMLIKRFNSCRH